MNLRCVLSVFALFLAQALEGAGNPFFLTGIVYPINDVEVSLPIDGEIVAITVREGDFVSAGQTLIQLDDSLQQLEVSRRERIWKDTSQLETARKNLELLRELVETKEELFESTRTVSQSELKRNQIQLNEIEGQYKALLESQSKAEIEYQIARRVLESYRLDAPLQGQIVEITPAPGEWVRTGQPVIRLVDASRCFLDVDVDLVTARAIASAASPVEVQIDEGTEALRLTASEIFVSPVADGGSGLVRIKVYFENPDNTVTPGITGRLVLE
jgi:RND family efflux transporter MFP subunit